MPDLTAPSRPLCHQPLRRHRGTRTERNSPAPERPFGRACTTSLTSSDPPCVVSSGSSSVTLAIVEVVELEDEVGCAKPVVRLIPSGLRGAPLRGDEPTLKTLSTPSHSPSICPRLPDIEAHVGVPVAAHVDASGRSIDVGLLDRLSVAQVRMGPEQSFAFQKGM